MKEFTLPNGEVIVVKPLTSAVIEAASRQLSREGVQIKGANDTLLHDNVTLNTEMIRQVLVSWRLPDGTEPLLNLRPAKAREKLVDTPGMDNILTVAKNLAEKAVDERKIDMGN